MYAWTVSTAHPWWEHRIRRFLPLREEVTEGSISDLSRERTPILLTVKWKHTKNK